MLKTVLKSDNDQKHNVQGTACKGGPFVFINDVHREIRVFVATHMLSQIFTRLQMIRSLFPLSTFTPHAKSFPLTNPYAPQSMLRGNRFYRG